MFLQTILSEGGKVLSVESGNLLRKKYPGIPYMENVQEEMQQGGVVARFECSSFVDCLDVSKNLDYMVCECANGKLQLWSLDTFRNMCEGMFMVSGIFVGPPDFHLRFP